MTRKVSFTNIITNTCVENYVISKARSSNRILEGLGEELSEESYWKTVINELNYVKPFFWRMDKNPMKLKTWNRIRNLYLINTPNFNLHSHMSQVKKQQK